MNSMDRVENLQDLYLVGVIQYYGFLLLFTGYRPRQDEDTQIGTDRLAINRQASG
jgi:hypothetical protein